MTLQEFFNLHPNVAIACSGGVDSAYLVYAAKKYAKEVKAYFIKSQFQPTFEQEDFLHLMEICQVPYQILEKDILAVPCVRENPADRCYYCKRAIFTEILEAAQADGFAEILDGTNASDDAEDRPGMVVLQEMSVFSPLRMCGIPKTEVRRLSKEAGLFTWEKPAYACLATRIPTGEPITAEKLQVTEEAEGYLASLGFADFRIRTQGETAKIQLREEQMPFLFAQREKIVQHLKRYYKNIVLDMEVRR